MAKNISGKTWLVIVVLVVAVIALAWVSHTYKRGPAQAPVVQQPASQKSAGNSGAPTAPPSVAVAPLSAGQAVASLPADFPTETGGKVLVSDRQVNDQTRQVKIVRTTTTSKDLPAAYKAYSDWLNKNSWVIQAVTDIPTLKSVTASKDGNDLSVVVSYDGGSKSNIVVVTYTVPEK